MMGNVALIVLAIREVCLRSRLTDYEEEKIYTFSPNRRILEKTEQYKLQDIKNTYRVHMTITETNREIPSTTFTALYVGKKTRMVLEKYTSVLINYHDFLNFCVLLSSIAKIIYYDKELPHVKYNMQNSTRQRCFQELKNGPIRRERNE